MMTLRKHAWRRSIDRSKSSPDAGGTIPNDDPILSYSALILAVGNAVGAIFMLRIAIYLLRLVD